MILAYEKPEIKAGLILLTLALPIIFMGWLMKTVMLPIVIASVLYVLLEPIVNWLQRNSIHKVAAIGIVLLTLVAVITFFIAYTVPALLEQSAEFRARLPQMWENFSQLSNHLENWLNLNFGINTESGGFLPLATDAVKQWSGKFISSMSGVLADVVLWLMLIPIITFFFLRDFRSLRNQLISLTSNRLFEKTLTIYHKVSSQLELYVRGVMLQSLIMAIITSIGFTIIGLPMAIISGILAGIFNLIPYVGPLLALTAPLLIALSISVDPGMLLSVVAVIAIAQLNDNVIVVPAILARAANLHPLIALLAIIVAGHLFGLIGMVFALPVLASARIIYIGVLYELRAIQWNAIETGNRL
jgi:predicted PurR-regulated permease PerM